MNLRRLFFLLLILSQLYDLNADAQAPCPVDACVTADPDDNLGLIMANSQSGICSPPISCYASNLTGGGGSAPSGSASVPKYTHFATCNPSNAACIANATAYQKLFNVAYGNLKAMLPLFAPGTQQRNRLGDVVAMLDGGTITVDFDTVPGNGAADTVALGNAKFTITFDMSKISDIATMTIDLAHELTHANDLALAAQGAFPNLTSLFQAEYRAYETSSWAAQGFGVKTFTFGTGVTIWDSGWPPDQRAALLDQAATRQVLAAFPNDPSHAEVQPHDPYPKQ